MRTKINEFREKEEKKHQKKKQDIELSNCSTFDFIEQFAKSTFQGKITPSIKRVPAQRTKSIHTLVLSDLHIGADLCGSETGTKSFGAIEEARKLASIVKGACLYKSKKDVKLKLLLLGDIIENQLHDSRTGATIAEQVARAIHLLSQVIGTLACYYDAIDVECSTGNHGRNTQRHQTRAIHQKWDSLETIIYYSLKAACSNLKHVKFNIPLTPMGYYTIFGKHIAYTHGDTVLKVGNPGTKLDVKSLENQMNRINASLLDKEQYSIVIYGHTHVAHVVHLNNGTIALGNGSLPPPDHFAVSIGIMESHNGQWIFESTEESILSDLSLLKAHDDDESLDKIIKPWTGF